MSDRGLEFGRELLNCAVEGTPGDDNPLRHVADLAPRTGKPVPWPAWAHPDVVRALHDHGITAPWSHQLSAAQLAHDGRHVVISTGTASGKSLAYQLPILSALADDPRARVLYLSPTKALGHDQLRAAHALTESVAALRDVAPAPYDGDSATEVRRFARERSRWIFSNPDMIHLSLLRNHSRWAVFLRNLRYIVVDECHYYRGIFGSNVAMVLRRLLRLCERYSANGATPTVIFASATTSSPAETAAELIGQTVVEVTEDGSPQGARTIALWEPALLPDLAGENGAPVRRSAGSEAGRVMADLVAEGARTLTFVRSRRGAELTALGARARLSETAPDLVEQVASYRAGYLAEDRRELEHALSDGRLRGLATTNALELGIDIAGLDAVVMAGFPGTVASFWQQAGRSGRRGQGALVVLIARDDPLDTYLVHHPAALLDKPIERVVIDPTNPHVLGPQLLCAAAELPLTEAEVRRWDAEAVAQRLVDDGLLRKRPAGYFPAPGVDPHPAVDIRGSTGGQIAILEADTGRMLGSAGAGQAASSVHPGAVYLHQGESYVVDSLDFEDGIAFVHAEDPGYTTFAREITDISVTGPGERVDHGPVTIGLVPVSVTNTVVGYLRRRMDGEVIDFVELDMPPRTLDTMAVMCTITPEALQDNGIEQLSVPGALHAAEHASIGLLPLVASCDRGDIGGVSTAVGPVDGLPSIFVYDGYPGGAGFADRGYRQLQTWWGATAAAIEACECPSGCPSCVQSPKCGNGNDPLDKAGAVKVLRLVLGALTK
ncbi:DEAD/DEAH box helicase [Mycolicibacterium smegmatis]|uniref:DEAD/DEAH box helicase n=4 Tax=Mycobacteriaceae TaxID=1762 RepID=I7GG60_MYCS2|nr:DEAD/DEAH box helicase [Mycolicibacterium smegmatis]ABK70646.1 ATP-dependent rna helicase, dead/deah box family protein [Mycolicibacterium smegmatis MC2 155]AFP42434.1 DEAD/DEAH box helicase [Mycolicibacterium smegmatis MC2 155]AIU11156.1 DEAD/DEAH box helicase [Mycolicibacterium smegmatis MC2 155]AIU17780.1 DEAD/DEAH box helicase [Mycolicibacterium smegmatis]AIU24404.1 DEAD/DEAH box helicase [Mycolicibacterium smegmatis]